MAAVVATGCYHAKPEADPQGNQRPDDGDGKADDGSDDGSCVDECVPGSAECVGDGVRACRRENGCARYSPVTPCGAGSVCEDGVCVVQGGGANLYVGPESICWLENGDVLCDVSVCNGGSAPAPASTIKFFLDSPAASATCADPAIPGEMWFAVDGVAAGTCAPTGTVLFFDAPTPGNHRLALFVDGLCEAPEADEDDNYVVLTPDLNVPAPAQPELWFNSTSTLYWDPNTNQMWGEISVCNFGSAAAGAFYIDFSPNHAAEPACGFIGAEFQMISGLEPGACTPTWATTRHAPGTGIDKRARVVVDSECAVAESNEINTWTWDYL